MCDGSENIYPQNASPSSDRWLRAAHEPLRHPGTPAHLDTPCAARLFPAQYVGASAPLPPPQHTASTSRNGHTDHEPSAKHGGHLAVVVLSYAELLFFDL